MKRHTSLVTLLAGCSLLAIAPGAYAQSTEDVDEIVVTGIRSSLEAAIDLKRNDSRIVDAIVAEDIGKLPDNNIAEALQRITGVSITTDFGIGESVSIRGLSENRVELNGRSTIGDDRDGISLDDFPSSFLKTVEVIKSPTADMIEGALGGTVRMSTIRPLELSERLIAGSLDIEYADKTENYAPIVNFGVGDSWVLENGSSIGLTGNISYQDREIRQDEYLNRIRLYDEDVNGLTANTPSGRFAVPEQNTIQQYVQERERLAVNLSGQWAPASDQGSVYLDLAYTDRSGLEAGSSILDVAGSRVYNSNTTQDENGQISGFTLEGAFVIPKTWSDFRNTEFSSYALGGEWDFTEQLNVSGEISIGTSESYRPNTEFNLRPISRDDFLADGSINNHTINATYLQLGDRIPSIVYSDPLALTSPDNLAIRQLRADQDTTTNEETAYRLDVEYDNPFEFDFISSISAGARFTQSDYEFDRLRYRSPQVYNSAYNADGSNRIVWIDEIEAAIPNSITLVDHNNSFNQHDLSGIFNLIPYSILDGNIVADQYAAFDVLAHFYADAFDSAGNPLMAATLDENLVRQEGAYRNISEDTTALYLSTDLEYDRLSATVGARYVETELESTILESGVEVAGTHSYDDLLPSLNLSYDVADDTKLRFAAAKVMRRPNYDELSPAFTVDGAIATADRGAIDLDPFRATQYDVSIEHYMDNGGLLSFAVFYKDVESFLTDSSTCEASSLTSGQQVTEWQRVCLLDSVGVDNPDVINLSESDFTPTAQQVLDGITANDLGEAFVTTQRDAGLTGIETAKKTNGENGTVEGFEIGFQQPFTFLPGPFQNFGINANYTYAKSEQPNGNPLLNISENTLNTQLYYENDSFQARLAYNYRDDYLFSENETRIALVGARALNVNTDDETSASFDPTTGNNYREARGQLDASASWKINDNYTLAGSITNLLGEPVTFAHELGSSWRYYEADRRYAIGVRAKF